MNIDDIIENLPALLAARLEADPFFHDIPVVVADKGNVRVQMEAKAAVAMEKSGKRGAAVIVLQLEADDILESQPGGPLLLKPKFQTLENVELNDDEDGTGKSHRKIARRIILIMKATLFDGLVDSIKCDKPCLIPTDLTDIAPNLVGSQVNFTAQEFSGQQIRWCLPPAIATVPGSNPPQFTITSPTPGAEVWYVTGPLCAGNFPWPGGPDVFPASKALKYCEPIPLALNTPVMICCAAYLPGSIASAVKEYTVLITSNP